MANPVAQVVFSQIEKSYPARSRAAAARGERVPVLQGIDLTIRDGEFLVVVGPSGCGKSTLLRLLAGLEQPSGGRILVGDRCVNDLPPKERDIAMVFQSYALYPHLSVYDNLAFGLRRMGVKPGWGPWLQRQLSAASREWPAPLRYQPQREAAIRRRVLEVARMLQLEELLDRLPKQLSGGQKQRVALGRAIARNPQVFLMDEPLSNLDAKLRQETRAQIVQLQRQLGITTLYVTHDPVEAMTMGDRIAVFNAGHLQQLATPLELYHRPANQFVATFIGSPPMNLIPVTVRGPLQLQHPQFRCTLPEEWGSLLQPYEGLTLTLGLRPEHLTLAAAATKNIPVQVELIEALGSDQYLQCRLEGASAPLQARLSPEDGVQRGESIWLSFRPEQIHLFEPTTGLALRPQPQAAPRIELPFQG